MVVFANKYTGAAAVAELEVRALRTAGIDARLLFTAGRNLETRLANCNWAVPGLVKERTPARILANLRRIRYESEQADVIVCHLPHDHLLCAATGCHRRGVLIRSFRHPRHFRSDPWHRAIGRRCHGVITAHAAMADELPTYLHGLPTTSFPVPLEERFEVRSHDGGDWRQRLGIPAEAPVVGMVGKLAPSRGFDLLLEAAARTNPRPDVVIVGHGEARTTLEGHAAALGLSAKVHWAGFVDDGLPSLYAAMDAVVFAAAGSDWGHRTISEAQSCGRPVIACDLPGVRDLIDDGRTGLVVARDVESLAGGLSTILGDRDRAITVGEAAAAAVAPRRLLPAGRRLATFLQTCVGHRSTDLETGIA
jgi:glycosyltransferase involved in cell wall biosynthesis